MSETTFEVELRPQVTRVPASLQPALVYLAALAPGSRPTMASSLQLVAEILTTGACDLESMPWHLLRRPHLNAVREWLQENRSPATANRVLAAVRGVLKNAWELGLLDAESYHRAVAVKNLKATQADRATGRALSTGEVRELMSACLADEGAVGLRDGLIIVLGVYGGLRRAEIAGLDVADVDFEDEQLTIRGKRRKTRVLPLVGGMLDLLADWVHVRGGSTGSPTGSTPSTGSGAESALLIRVRKGGEMLYERLSVQAIHEIVQRRGEQAGVRKFSSHDLRRSFAGDLLDAGADIATVADLMGHSNVQTTRLYDRRGQRARVKAMGMRHVQYERRYG